MKTILKPIFELVTGEFMLSNNIIYNYIALTIIGLIAFSVAWRFVGSLYDMDIINGKFIGSIIHWTVRVIVFIVVFYVFSFVLWLIKFILSVPFWTWIVVVLGVIIFIVLCVLLKSRKAGEMK